MGLADREYYGSGGGGRAVGMWGKWSVTKWLIAINVAVHLVRMMMPQYRAPYPTDAIEQFGYFSTDRLTGANTYEVWRLITFQFLHHDLLHIFFNMFGLYIFGEMVEQHLGSKRYAAFYLVCGIAGGVMYLLLNVGGYFTFLMGMPKLPFLLYDRASTPLVGASAGVFGVIMAAAYIAPDARVQPYGLPIGMRLKTFAYVYVGIAALNLLLRFNANAGGDAAHLGGAAAGAFFVRHSHLLREFFDVFGPRPDPPPGPRARGPAPEDSEVDRILSKVATDGLASLTERERRVLRDATDARRAG